jgi:hypothetical protein
VIRAAYLSRLAALDVRSPRHRLLAGDRRGDSERAVPSLFRRNTPVRPQWTTVDTGTAMSAATSPACITSLE